MRINDVSNQEVSLYHDALDLVDANSDTWSFTKFVRGANFALDEVLRKILRVNGRWQYADSNDTNIGTFLTDLIAAQADYTLDDSHFIIRRLRIKDKNGVWKTLTPTDKRDLTDTDLNATGEPVVYDKVGRSLMLYPTPDYSATGGIELTVQSGSNYFVVGDTTKEPGIDPIFHRYISLYPARDYASKYNKDRVSYIDTLIQRLDEEVKELYATRDQDEAPTMTIERTLNATDAGIY